ncbi:MAG: UbiA family prenyltransferase [Patescibacteria group bacterium]
MRDWIKGTVRPISFLAVVPVLLGAIVSGTRMDHHIAYALLGAILAVGFANSFNIVIDRKIDKHNPDKKTLAIRQPVRAWYGVLFLLPPLAFCLRNCQFNHILLSILFYLSCLYSYLYGNVPVLKRISVAAIVAATAFLDVERFNLAVWVLAVVIFAFIYWRESHKDSDDRKEDTEMKFAWIRTGITLNWWLVTAPIAGAAIYLSCLVATGKPISTADIALALGIAISIWSYVQIRSKYHLYKVRLAHGAPAGRLGIVVSMVGLMPSFVNPLFLAIVVVNCASIIHRSFRGQIPFHTGSIAHDAYLWASLPLMAMAKVGYHPLLLAASILLASVTCANMHRLKCATTPAM